ncbi:hypothetical protein GQ54DRAFT_314381 [Martensiomyces pterosporus]|nr:hypothetical protein GQ54DRAFT_314381 [Martensiomyces pterosporus]
MIRLVLVLLLLAAQSIVAFDINLIWDVPDNAVDITQISSHIMINSTSSPIGTEWIGAGWGTGAISIQKLANDQLMVIMQVRAPTNESSVRAGRVTEYASAHYIDSQDRKMKQGMYLQSKIDKDDSESSGYSLKVVAHYNMVANNTIYQGLWSDGDVWTYMGSLVLQHPKSGSIKEEVAKALEDAAKADDKEPSKPQGDTALPTSSPAVAIRDPLPDSSVPASRDPLGGTKPPEVLATCEINREATGRIRPVCKFIRQLPMIPSFSKPFSAIRRTADGNAKFERAGIWKDLSLKNRLGTVYDIAAARCVSHNRGKNDMASCQKDPNSPEFYIAIDGATPKEIKEKAELLEGGNGMEAEAEAEESGRHHAVSKLPQVDEA